MPIAFVCESTLLAPLATKGAISLLTYAPPRGTLGSCSLKLFACMRFAPPHANMTAPMEFSLAMSLISLALLTHFSMTLRACSEAHFVSRTCSCTGTPSRRDIDATSTAPPSPTARMSRHANGPLAPRTPKPSITGSVFAVSGNDSSVSNNNGCAGASSNSSTALPCACVRDITGPTGRAPCATCVSAAATS